MQLLCIAGENETKKLGTMYRSIKIKRQRGIKLLLQLLPANSLIIIIDKA